jgi:hypothetical protein
LRAGAVAAEAGCVRFCIQELVALLVVLLLLACIVIGLANAVFAFVAFMPAIAKAVVVLAASATLARPLSLSRSRSC